MSNRTFIDIHVLQTVPPSCLNRDDTGSPKTATFGGVTRARVSSQAWKKATRADFNGFLDTRQLGERTLHAVARIAERAREFNPELDEQTAQEFASKALTETGIKTNRKKSKESDTADEEVTGYLVFLSRAQIDALARLAVSGVRGDAITKSAARRAMSEENSIDVALFGRMIADVPELSVDAACQVSHAISVHAAATEFDYFTAVDDNAPEDNAGAGMIGTVEFVAATLYRYATIDVARLTENLGSAEAANRAIEAFLRAFVTSMPTGKQNTFANRTRPGFLLLEVRDDQPVNLSGAFENPISATGDVLATAAEALVRRALSEDAAFGTKPVWSGVLVADEAARAAADALEGRAELKALTELLSSVSDVVRNRTDQTAQTEA